MIPILASFATYLFLQWPIIVTTFWVLVAGLGMLTFVLSVSSYETMKFWTRPDSTALREQQTFRGLPTQESTIAEIRKEMQDLEARFRRNCKILLFAVVIGAGLPNQKTLGTAVAVGVATYAVQETLDDPTVKKFFAVIRKVADNELDDKLKSLSDK